MPASLAVRRAGVVDTVSSIWPSVDRPDSSPLLLNCVGLSVPDAMAMFRLADNTTQQVRRSERK